MLLLHKILITVEMIRKLMTILRVFSERLLVRDDVVSPGPADRHSCLPQAGGLLQSPGLRHLWVRSAVFGLVLFFYIK